MAALRSGFRAPIVQWRAGDSPVPSESPATLILDDVSVLSRADQERLFAWLQQHYADVQVVARTSRPLLPLVQDGEFLAPLYYALNVIHLEVPE